MRLNSLALAACLLASAPLSARAFEIREAFGNLFGTTDIGEIPEYEGVKLLKWEDLTPPLSDEARGAAAELNARIDMMSDEEIARAMTLIDENGNELIEELDGETVSIKGYLVPLDFEATEATAFVLVPYMGACIHVPPPPPNQIIYVEYEDGVSMEALEQNFYALFRVTGELRAARARTDLADVGYQMTADRIAMVDS